MIWLLFISFGRCRIIFFYKQCLTQAVQSLPPLFFQAVSEKEYEKGYNKSGIDLSRPSIN